MGGTKIMSLRFSNVMLVSEKKKKKNQFARWDPGTKIMSLRFSNVMLVSEYASFESWQSDPNARRWNCWGYIDARDGAQAVSKALASNFTGHHQYLIAAADTCMRQSNEKLVNAAFPHTTYLPTKGANDSLPSIEKAKKDLGYKPQYSWHDFVTAKREH